MSPWQEQAMAHWPLINQLASRRFKRDGLAEEAALFVLDGLAQDDWARLRAFAGRSSLRTYLTSLTMRLLEDFARRRFGRVSPPLWLRRLGGFWLTLFRLLCLERYSPDEAVALLVSRQQIAAQNVEEAAYRLLAEIPDCGEHRGEEQELDEEKITAHEADCSNQEQRLEEEEKEKMFAVLARLLFADNAAKVDGRLLAAVARAGLQLNSEEQLLLKLCFRDGVAVTEAGRMLGLNRFQVHGRLRRLLTRLRQELEGAGLAEELRRLL